MIRIEPDEILRNELEASLEKLGDEMGMKRSVCIASTQSTGMSYDGSDGSYHGFDLAPVGSDTYLPEHKEIALRFLVS